MQEQLIEGFKLSLQQKRVWLLQQGGQGYSSQSAVIIRGELDEGKLKAALQRVVDRHEILRTTFQRVEWLDTPFQIVSDEGRVALERVDLAESEIASKELDVDRLFSEERERDFDLARGPLLRAKLASISRTEHVLLLSVPALCADSFSHRNLVKEIASSYDADPGDYDSEESLIQYADFSAWQEELLDGEEAEVGKKYWRDRRIEGIEPPRLPFEEDSVKKEVHVKEGDSVKEDHVKRASLRPSVIAFSLDAIFVNAVECAAASNDAPPAAFLLACWQVMVWRLCGQSRVTVGAVCDGRSYSDLNQSLGLFAKCLPVQTHLQPENRFIDVLASVTNTLSEAYSWQEYFTWQEMEAGRADGSATLFFPYVFDYQQFSDDYSNGRISLSFIKHYNYSDRFKIKLSCVRYRDSLNVEFHFDPAFFAPGSIEQVKEHFRTLIESAVENPARRISQLEILGDEQRRRLLIDFNSTAADFGQVKCVHHLFERQAKIHPTNVAVTFRDQQLTYAELNERADQLADYLYSQGIGPENTVGIFMHRCLEMIPAILAVLKAGAAYLPLDPAHPRQRLAWMIEDARAQIVLTKEELEASLSGCTARKLCVDSEREANTRHRRVNRVVSVDAENLAYVIYTSGSTGKPKGVMIPHRAVVNYLSWAAKEYEAWNGFGTPVHSPLTFDLTVTSLFLPLISGQTVELLGEEDVIEELSRRIGSGRDYSLVKLTPAHLDVLAQLLSEEDARPRPRALVIGGEALREESLAYWRNRSPGTRLINEYGPTETAVGCCVYEAPPEKSDSKKSDSGSVPIGRPIANTRLYILDDYLQPVPQSVTGELYVGGEGVGRGYLSQPDLTAAQFIPDHFSRTPGARLYKTGDLCRFLPSGNVEFIGRKDTQVKVRGFRIELAEIEGWLRKHPRIAEAAVLAREDLGGEKRLVGYVVAKAGGAASDQELIAFLKTSLPEYMVPARFVTLKSFPLTANGKVDRQKLPPPDIFKDELADAYVAPQTSEEKTLAAIWGDVLGINRVSVLESFFSLGGDSILSIQVRSRAQKAGLHFSTQQFFERPTIRELAQALSRDPLSDSVASVSEPFSLISREDREKLPADVEDAYPLTRLQAGMIFHSVYSSQWAVYHDVASFHLRGPLKLDLLEAALDHLLARHAMLRASFDITSYSESLQLIHKAVSLPLHVEDLRGHTASTQKELIAASLQSEKERKFDLSRPPLLRVTIHWRSDESFQLTISKHHAILDGWSNAAMLAELLSGYTSMLEQGSERGPEPPPLISFRDYVALERETLESDEARRFWAEKLSDSAITKLPRLIPLRAVDGPQQVRAVNVPISLETSEKLTALVRSASVPLKSILLAAHVRALSLMSGQRDVMTGMIANGRLEQADGDRVLGLFLNALPLRIRLSGGTWLQLARQTFEAEQECFPFRRFPLAEIQRINGSQPLFEVSFNFNHFHIFRSVADIGGPQLLDYEVFEENSFLLTAQFSQDPATSHLYLTLRCNMTELSETQVDSIKAYYSRVLDAIVNDPSRQYEAEALLPEAETRQLLVEWNDSKRDYFNDDCAHHIFERQVERTPQALALSFEGASLTYFELNRKANRLAHYLRKLGVGPETRVGLRLERSLESITGLLAILKSGAAYVPLDAECPKERLDFMLSDAGISVLLTQQRLASSLAAHACKVVCLDSDDELISTEGDLNPNASATSESMAYVLYTSGSTGKPKGVMVEHRQILNYSRGFAERVKLPSGASFAMVQPLTVDAVVGVIFPTLFTGGHLHIISRQRAGDSHALAEYFESHAIECLKLAPSHLAALHASTARPEAVMPRKRLVVGGEASDWRWLQQLKALAPACMIINHYGPTETTVGVLTHEVEKDEAGQNYSNTPLGRPLANTQIYILDAFLQPAPVGVPGELYIGGENVARGYLGRPDLTAERFIPDPFGAEPGARLYKTGDLARRFIDGNIDFLGRIDHQVKIRGYRIELGEIQAALARHPKVQDSVVIARDDGRGEKRIVAYLVAGRAQAPTVGEMRNHLKEQLPEYMMPGSFVMLDALPLSKHGKVDLTALPAPEALRPELAPGYEAPRSEVERLIASLWQEALHLEKVGVHDSFFDLGGHSLLVMRVHGKLKEKLDRDIPMLEMFNNPTISSLAKYLSRDDAAPAQARENRARAQSRREASKQRWEVRQQRMGSSRRGVQDE